MGDRILLGDFTSLKSLGKRGKSVILSEAKNLSLVLGPVPREILRFAQDDKNTFSAASSCVRTNFHRRMQQLLTFAARCRSSFCMYPYGKYENRSFKKANYPLRLQASLMAEARRVAKAEGVSLNQLINVAVAEKVAAVRAEAILRAAPPGMLQIFEQAAKLRLTPGGA